MPYSDKLFFSMTKKPLDQVSHKLEKQCCLESSPKNQPYVFNRRTDRKTDIQTYILNYKVGAPLKKEYKCILLMKGEELFYMRKGDMELPIMEQGKFK